MRTRYVSRFWVLRLLSPPELLIVSFAAMILIGSFALMLPNSTVRGNIGFVDALFTATSAVCVTGLTVVDTGTFYTRSGQIIILCLIQLGGLGILTFSVLLLLRTRRKISMKDKVLSQDTFIPRTARDSLDLVKLVLVSTFVIESIGALFLWLAASDRTWFAAVFHSISAFCNAGFELTRSQPAGSRHHAGVNLIICALVVVGGLGFFTNLELARLVGRKPRSRLSLHTRLVVAVTLVLIFGGALSFYTFENENALRAESTAGALLGSLFQSITARTAGFSIIDCAELTNATLFMVILLMFVGASPGSTGGGIKTSTLGVLVAMARSKLRGEESVSMFGRTIPDNTVARCLAVLVLAFTLVTFATLALAFVEVGTEPYRQSSKHFIEIFFEVVSAFATCGLSTGITPQLSGLGKLILILVMFVGRVGPLLIATAVGRSQARPKYRYAEENVIVG